MNTNSFTGSLAEPSIRRPARLQLEASRWRNDVLSIGLIALWVMLMLTWVYREPQPLLVNIGSSYARAYLRGFDQPERNQQYNYAFTGARAEIFVPGAGRGPFVAAVNFDGVRPPNAPPAQVSFAADAATITFAPSVGLRSYHLLLPAADGDLAVEISSNTFQPGENDPRRLGVPIDRLVARATEGGLPLRAGMFVLLLAIGLYALLRRLAVRSDLSVLVTLLVVSSLIYGLFTARLLITVGLVRWLLVLLGLHVALWPLRQLVLRIYERIGLPLEPTEEAWLWRIFAAATLVKLGGMLYPHAIIFDEAAHVLRMGWILEGRFLELYRPGYTSYMGDTVGLGGGQFPYSPLWYLVVVPFHYLGIGLGDATNGLSALMDVSKLFLIHVIARVTLNSRTGALLAGALYHLIPMPYFLLSWGNYPTQFGLWAALLATAFIVVNYERFGTRRVFWGWVACMALAILSYTVLGVFSVTFFVLLGFAGLIQRRTLDRQRLRFLLVGMVVAELFCFAIYHVQFAQAIVTQTLPAIVMGTTDRVDNSLAAEADPRDNALANFSANNQFTVSHFTPLVLLFTVLGGIVLARNGQLRRWAPLWIAWWGLFVLYTLASAYVADMVLKHVFFIMPLVCIWAAALLAVLWRRRWIGQGAVVLVIAFLVAEVATRGHHYLLVKRHFS